MQYKAVFWDIDGTLYDSSKEVPKREDGILDNCHESKVLPHEVSNLWLPYEGLPELMSEIPRERQGIITNGYDFIQRGKLIIFGLDKYINPDLIFTSYGEAEKILDTPNHPVLEGRILRGTRTDQFCDLTWDTSKPKAYMFNLALDKCGYSAEDCVMIGDKHIDIFGASRAGMKSIYISGLEEDSPVLNGNIFRGDVVKREDVKIVEKGDISKLRKLLL